MAISTPTNPDLPSSVLLPGVFLKLNLSSGGAGLNMPSKRLLLIGGKTSGGTAAQDSPIQVTSQSDANTYFGRGSDLARMYAAAVSAIGPGAADIYGLPLADNSSGTQATRLITVAGTATSSGSISATICGYNVSAAIASGDTANTIAGNLNTAIGTLLDLPCTAAVVSATITLTYRHKGIVGNDLPIIVNLQGAGGITASCGTVTYTNNATSTGAITVSVGSTTYTYTVTNLDTPTTTASGIAAVINETPGPVTATASTGVVTLNYVNDRVVNRIAASMGTVTGTTVALACGTAPTPGSTQVASLTNALSNLATQGAYPVWCISQNDGGTGSAFHGGAAAATSTIGTIKTHITTYSDGYNQKGQTVMFGATEALATAGGYQTSTGVNTTTQTDGANGRFVEIWQVDSPQQAYELAARAAALRIAQDYKPKNYAGMQVSSKGTVPLLAPHRQVRSGPSDLNSALYTYYMTPIAFDDASGSNYIVRDRTCSPDPDQRIWSWGGIDTPDYIRGDMNSFLSKRFSGKSFKASVPRSPNVVTAQSIKEAIAERLRSYDSIDFVDDISSIVAGVTSQQDAIVLNRVNVFIPLRIPVPLYQVSGNLNLI